MSDKAKDKAKEVLGIIEHGGFSNAAGEWIDISEEIQLSVTGSKTYSHNELKCIETNAEVESNTAPNIFVTDETTQIAASRIYKEGYTHLVLLNFASAFSPGGGFLNGAKAQEEDLARCSTIYQCLKSQNKYYEDNINLNSMLFNDQIIYSFNVPWFRKRSRDKPNELYFSSVISAPAPNAKKALEQGEDTGKINTVLKERCRYILNVAKDNGHENLILGAWGCGVFGNHPEFVAKTFNYWLKSTSFKSAFKNITFAIYDPSKTKDTYNAFVREFLNK